MRFHAPVFVASLSLSLQAKSAEEVAQEAERALEEHLTANPEYTDTLHALMECKIKARKIEEAMAVLDRLIEVDLEEYEWSLLKANMHIYNDEHAQARNLFEEILKRDPLRQEAFHDLVMATSESNEPLRALLRRVEEALEACKKQNRDSDVREFKLLIANFISVL
uniref:Uncharacterized protein n=1 Tax=Cajanus cajan TaxID=3821 RepID=A0A151RY62_CAJCA|nr:hypothetical protein KK1_030887 [Cajanus cajan]